MSRLFEALSNVQVKRRSLGVVPAKLTTAAVGAAPPEPVQEVGEENYSPGIVPLAVAPPDMIGANAAPPENTQDANALNHVLPARVAALEAVSVSVETLPESRVVALTNPNGLGAEKFRALVTRLDHLRKQRELKSIQVTSSMIHEGKTLVASNVAITLAKYSGSKTLLIEGDMRRPTLAALLGLSALPGLSHWWSGLDPDPTQFVYKLKGMPLWFLPAGKPCDQPSEIIRSVRFMNAFAQLASQFEWIVVDSTPMLPIVDVNLWSKLVDGTLLVVREGMTPVKALKKGLQALDHPNLIGVVLNEASESNQANYNGQYYSTSKHVAE